MDVCKTKKGINVSQKKFVSPVLVLIRDCSDRQLPHLLPGPGRETVRFKPCVAAVLPAPGIWIPRVRPANCNLESVRGQKKIMGTDAMPPTLLNKHIRIQDGCRKSLLWAYLFCSNATCPERPLVAHTGQGGVCVTHKIHHLLGGLLTFPISSPAAPLLLSHSIPEMQLLPPCSSWRTGYIANRHQGIWIHFSYLLHKCTSSTILK